MSFYLDLNVGGVSTRHMLSRLNKSGHRQGCFAGVHPTMHVQPTGMDGTVSIRYLLDYCTSTLHVRAPQTHRWSPGQD